MTQIQQVIWEKGQDVWKRLSGKEIFITGGTGFFGRSLLELVNAFNQEKSLNLKITVLTRDKKQFLAKWNHLCDSRCVSFHEGDIRSFEFPSQSFEHILHFATPANATMNIEKPLEMFDIIVEGTRRTLEFARKAKVKSIILASSGAVYGKQPPEISNIPESYHGAPSPQDKAAAYGEAKRVAELLGNIYSDNFGFEHKIARCFAFVGPHLDANGTFAIGNFIRDAVKGDSIHIKGDGTSLRSYMYSDDLVLWLFKILLDGVNKKAYNVGSEKALSIRQLAETVAKVINPKIKVEIAQAPTPGKAPECYVPSVALAFKELGLENWTPFEQAINETAYTYRRML